MGDEEKKKLEQKLWDVANELRGKMDAVYLYADSSMYGV
jgi:type I restriction-modification system DNA methylase subunit